VSLPKSWERVDGLHVVSGAASWVALASDEVGNLFVFRELVLSGLPSQVAPRLIEAREAAGCEDSPYAGPVDFLGPEVREWGAQSYVRDEYNRLGLYLSPANEDSAAGMTRIQELSRRDPEHAFPEGHPQAGAKGSPRLFLRGVPMLLEQLSSAPRAGDGEKPGVQQEWEQRAGGLVAALRYAVMSLPSPSEAPKKETLDMRQRAIEEMVRRYDEPQAAVPGINYE
jgi:hypothetical protein